MQTSRKLTQALLGLAALVMLSASALAADPGLPFPATSDINDQKAGSVLIYTVYSSNAANPNAENTKINITNTSSTSSAFVHLFLLDGSNCAAADFFVCLTPNQTTSFLTSDIDPGVSGYIIAVAASSVTGCPINFNFLIGDEFVKFATGHSANLGAEAISAVAAVPAVCDAFSVSADLLFNGVAYNRVPRVLALDSIASPVDGNSTLLIVDRVSGNLLEGTGNNIGTLFGILYDDVETAFSFTIPFSGCQLKRVLTDTFPRTAPRFSVVIPQGQTGWAKIWATAEVGIVGSMITYNPAAGTSASAFNGGHNLHKLTLVATETLTIPIFAPTGACFF